MKCGCQTGRCYLANVFRRWVRRGRGSSRHAVAPPGSRVRIADSGGTARFARWVVERRRSAGVVLGRGLVIADSSTWGRFPRQKIAIIVEERAPGVENSLTSCSTPSAVAPADHSARRRVAFGPWPRSSRRIGAGARKEALGVLRQPPYRSTATRSKRRDLRRARPRQPRCTHGIRRQRRPDRTSRQTARTWTTSTRRRLRTVVMRFVLAFEPPRPHQCLPLRPGPGYSDCSTCSASPPSHHAGSPRRGRRRPVG